MRLFDSHAHVQDAAFDLDRDEVIERAWNAGLTGMLVLGTNLNTSEEAIALAATHTGLYAAAGCHPHFAEDMDEASLVKLAALAAGPSAAVVGEIGLDFYRDLSPREQQLAVFQRQLEAAAETARPVAVHCRDARDAMLPILQVWSQRVGGSLPDGRPLGVMHYFSGDVELAQRYVELGFLISIHCSITYPKSEQLAAVALQLPLSTLVVETDSPYGAPQSQRGRRNEPAHVIEAVRRIAELRNEPIEYVAEATTENALRLLGATSIHARAAAANG